MRGVRLTNADASDASFRELDMQDSDFSGTNFYYAALEFSNLENVKVLSITNSERTQDFTWETAMVDHDFVYEVGKTVYPDNGFSAYGWMDDSPGLHFFMDRDMAEAFGTGNY